MVEIKNFHWGQTACDKRGLFVMKQERWINVDIESFTFISLLKKL